MTKFNPSDLKYEFKDFIGIYENAFTKEECENAIKLFKIYDEKKFTYERNYILQSNDKNLDLSGTKFIELDWDLSVIDSFQSRLMEYLYPIYSKKYSILQRLRKHRPKDIKIQKTCPTEGYHIWHCEHSALGTSVNRVLVWILYLNDVEEGGETEFLYQSIRIKPKRGTFVLWPAAFTHTHRGNPPLTGSKYIATGWIEYVNSEEEQGAFIPPDLYKIKNLSHNNLSRF